MASPNFFAELKRRNVYKIAVAYAVIGWVVVQITSTVFPTFHAPEWIAQTVMILVAVGFPIALVIAWAFELTPEGLKRTEDADVTAQKPRKGHTWIYLVIVGVAFSIGLFFIGRYTASPTAGQSRAPATTGLVSPKSIAVLPFENLTDDKGAAYFAEGIQDEILTKLAGIADLKVISRTSTAKYKSKPEDLQTVSQQLGVANVLEGSVQKVGDKVRVNVQLIDARADSHLWAKSYDGDASNIFGMETQVSQQVADALRAKLSPAEAERLAGAPTTNTEAYDLFLQGEFVERGAESTITAGDFERAADLYRRAIALDPNFALAYARLVMNRMLRHWYIDHLSAQQLQPIQEQSERALELAPNLPEAHIARGVVYYFGHRQYQEALTEFATAIRLQPNNARALEFSGYVHRRLGHWEESLVQLKKSQAQDPLNSNLLAETAVTYSHLRIWQDTDVYCRRALAINPHEITGMSQLIIATLNGKGDVKEARHLLDTVAAGEPLVPDVAHSLVGGLLGIRAYTCLLEHNTAAALDVFNDASRTFDDRLRYSGRVLIFLLGGDKGAAHSEAEKGMIPVEDKLRERPDDLDAIVQAGWIYLGLDRVAEAEAMAARAVGLFPSEKDALVSDIVLYNLAAIECRTGKINETIKILRRLLSSPAGVHVTEVSLRADPMWDPIRNEPAFRDLLTMKQRVGP